MSNEERYKSALERIADGAFKQGAHTGMSFSQVYRIAQEALNPPVEYEEVEVVRWIIRSSSLHMFHTKADAIDFCNRTGTPHTHIIEIKGLDKVPKKPKVMRREEIHWSSIHDEWRYTSKNSTHSVPNNATYYAEWPEEE